VEFRIKLILDFFGETKTTKLGKDLLEEGDFLLGGRLVSELEQEGLGLAEVSAGGLAEQEGEKLGHSATS
jgi:hypothetical protein